MIKAAVYAALLVEHSSTLPPLPRACTDDVISHNIDKESECSRDAQRHDCAETADEHQRSRFRTRSSSREVLSTIDAVAVDLSQKLGCRLLSRLRRALQHYVIVDPTQRRSSCIMPSMRRHQSARIAHVAPHRPRSARPQSASTSRIFQAAGHCRAHDVRNPWAPDIMYGTRRLSRAERALLDDELLDRGSAPPSEAAKVRPRIRSQPAHRMARTADGIPEAAPSEAASRSRARERRDRRYRRSRRPQHGV